MNTNVLRIVASVCTCMVMLSCGSNKVVQSGKKYTNPFESGTYELPCAVYDDEEYFAATGIAYGLATKKAELQHQALINAQNRVYLKLEHAVTGELRSYYESIGTDVGTDFDTYADSPVKRAIMGVVNATSESCTAFSGVDEKGNIEYYVAIKISKKKVAEAVSDALSQSEKESIRQRANDAFDRLSGNLKDYIEE